MGNSTSHSQISNCNPSSKKAEGKFTSTELHILKQTYKDLASRNAEDVQRIDKETFLKYLPLPGLFGERIFKVFDKRGQGAIGYDEFISGLAIIHKGDQEDKMKLLFDLFDLNSNGLVTKNEILTLLHNFPKESFAILEKAFWAMDFKGTEEINSEMIADKIVNECYLGTTESLSFTQFITWCDNFPGMDEFILSILPIDQSLEQNQEVQSNSISGRFDSNSGLKEIVNSEDNANITNDLNDTLLLLKQAKDTCGDSAICKMIENTIEAIKKIDNSGDGINSDMFNEVSESGVLWKVGNRLRQMQQRFYTLQGNFLYYYSQTSSSSNPKGVIFLPGCVVQMVQGSDNLESKGFYGFEISLGSSATRDRRVYYTKCADDCLKWVNSLKNASCKDPFEKVYSVEKEIGKGKFSVVCEAINKLTHEKVAVKIIDKSTMDSNEKELLRTEIAILKHVNHPNIIRMHDVYENQQLIYIVLELLKGGELFQRIAQRSRHTEIEAKNILYPLLESVSYLHDRGIVHRDIKPENILCGEDPSMLKIADFGLSKIISPEELMKIPCGTLNYVAPEVLSSSGYGKEADLWSIGIILFLLISGKLPFNGKNKDEIIQKTLNSDIKKLTDSELSSISPGGKDLMQALLDKNPSKRITAKEALQHKWFKSTEKNRKLFEV